MTVVFFLTGERHRLVRLENDTRIGWTDCGQRVVNSSTRCPDTRDHHAALPTCPNHQPVTPCPTCFRPKKRKDD